MPFLDWVNKTQATSSAAEVPYHLLQLESIHGSFLPPFQGKGRGGDGVDGEIHNNLLIQGDNLLALKALIPFYRGRVKCIYIDPPYNTQSAFTHYDDKLEHSQWLTMMYPRLVLLRELLAEDGSIWVSIDDREAHYLKVLMDEVFGRGNLLQSIIWYRKVSPANDAKWFSNDHDHIMIYAKNTATVTLKKLEREEKHNKGYTNPDKDARGLWNSVTLTGNKTPSERPNLAYSISNPNTEEIIFPPEGLTWRASKEKYFEMLADGLIYWGKDGKSKSPRIKRFLLEAKSVIPRSVWHYDEVGHTQESMLESKAMFLTPFGTPKPERLIQRILHIATNPGDLVLDSFLGSGTTAAVAHKMGRRWIGIEMGEHTVSHCIPRLEKVIAGEQGGISKAVNWQGGGGFRFHTLGEPVFDADGGIHRDVRFPALAAYLWHFETGSPQEPHPHPNLPLEGEGTKISKLDQNVGWVEGGVSPKPNNGVATHNVGKKENAHPCLPNMVAECESVAFAKGRNQTLPDPPLSGRETTKTFPPDKGGPRGVAFSPTPLLGINNNTAYYLLYNGILGDRRPQGGNVLTSAILEYLDETFPHDGPRIIYGETTRLGAARLRDAGITFKQIPYDIKAR